MGSKTWVTLQRRTHRYRPDYVEDARQRQALVYGYISGLLTFNRVKAVLSIQQLGKIRCSKIRLYSLSLVLLSVPHTRYNGRIVVDDGERTVLNQGCPYIYPVLRQLLILGTDPKTSSDLRKFYFHFILVTNIEISHDTLRFIATLQSYSIRNRLTNKYDRKSKDTYDCKM
jgi:hypothetical protein